MKTLLLLLLLSQLSFSDYINNGDGTFTNKITSITWQDESHVINTKTSWNDAINYCEGLTIGSNSNWRLPTINELISFIDYNNYDPTINSEFNYVTSADLYWSSTSAQTKSNAWFVDFKEGVSGDITKTTLLYMRCVTH